MLNKDKLAIHGGEPVRKTPLHTAYPGADVYGEEEKQAVIEVIEAQSPYRYYGPNVLGKVKSFELAFSEKIGTKHTLAVTSGTASLIVALKAAGIGPGDKVLLVLLSVLVLYRFLQILMTV
jgi:8-amino-3,8-dideoxy-alpha-D-manno-octulosonate transaminase